MVYNIINKRNRTGSPEKEDKEMLTIREEELNNVNGGTVYGETFGEAKFKVGDRVISKSHPECGVGIVVIKKYNEGWSYVVCNVKGFRTYPESDLEYALL